MPITPMSAALGEVILETRFLEQRWANENERTSMRRALFDIHKEVSGTLVLLDGLRPTEIDERTAHRAREAFLATLVLGVLLQRIVKRAGKRGAPAASIAASIAAAVAATAAAGNAVAKLLDALDPYVQRADAALRRVMLEGISSECAAQQIALPA